jgi:hypothetical protein
MVEEASPFAPSNPSEIIETWQIVAIHHISQDFQFVAGIDYAAADRGCGWEPARAISRPWLAARASRVCWCPRTANSIWKPDRTPRTLMRCMTRTIR